MNKRIVLAVIILSLAITFLRPFFGTKVALVLSVLLQVYLPGWILARALGKTPSAHPVSGFAWVLLSGLSLTICLGGLARFLQIPIPVYVLILHAVMLVIALLSPPVTQSSTRWHFSSRSLLLYGLLALCCLIAVGVGYERNQFRINGYEDQTVFISLADWLVHDPDNPGLIDRRVGVPVGDRRWETDGWTYNHAAWVWVSGVTAADLIWTDLTGLFMWTIPLVVFALAYELTQREEIGIWCAAALTLAALLTLDSLVYVPTPLAFGQFSLFQVNTLRSFSTALFMPMALMSAFAYLRVPRWHDLILIFLAGAALALLHPRQIVIFQASIGATLVIWWLANPTRARLKRGTALTLVLISLLALPYIQRLNRPGINRTNEQTEQTLITGQRQNPQNFAAGNFLLLENIPVVGTTYITKPEAFFYHPVIFLVVGIGLAAGIAWRKSLAAQYLFASTIITLILLFTPGLTPIVARLISATLVAGLIFMLPVALSLGIAFDIFLRALQRFRIVRHYGQSAFALILALLMLILLFEPFPVPASARDQIRASNRMQATRDMRASDRELVTTLNHILPNDERSVWIAPNHVANYIIENVPHTLIMGGRASSNLAHPANARFFTEITDRSPVMSPWLDTADLEAIKQYGVTHIAIEAHDSRLPQLWIQPQRFIRMASSAGYFIFEVQPDITANRYDELFAQMNAIYAQMGSPRWEPGHFELPRPADTESWRDIAAEWSTEEGELADYGLAFTYLMLGEDEQALPLWQKLHQNYSDVFLFRSAAANTQRMMNPSQDALTPLLDGLESPSHTDRVLAARDLLDPFFLYLLSDTQINQIIAAAESEQVTWDQLMNFDQPTQVRERVVLLMSENRAETAAQWLQNGLTELEISPRDLVLQASIALAGGNADGAAAFLYPSIDPDLIKANAFYHTDRWDNNIAAQMYEELAGTSTVYETQAANSQTLEFISPLAMAEHHALYVMRPVVEYDDEARTLTVSAVFGNPHGTPYPVQTWHVLITSPDASIVYAEAETPAVFNAPFLTRASFKVDLRRDLPPITPARVFIEARYDEALTFPGATLDILLNPPASAQMNADVTGDDLRFGEDIHLLGYAANHDAEFLDLTLYWQADVSLTEDYQVFIHVIGPDGEIAAQRDSAPVDNRYPTSQWQPDKVIEDRHIITFDSGLSAGTYEVRFGLYRLSDSQRLPIQPGDERVINNSLVVSTFSIP